MSTRSTTPHKPNPAPAHKANRAAAHDGDGPQRLQKILAAAGIGSRRDCEELILAGRVEVDRKVVKALGSKADPLTQEIRIDGTPLPRPKLVYFLINKPTGVVSTNHDPSGRPRVIDLVGYPGRLFTVGRLDMSSEGLILATNDGELANRLTHPRYGVEKTYQVEVAGTLEKADLDKLRKGVHLAEGFAHVASVKIVRQYKQSSLLEIVLNEGRNREIRRLLARVGHKVERLKRVALGPLRLADLPSGHVRALDREELRHLRQAAAGAATKPTRAKRPPVKKPVKAAVTLKRAVIGGDSSSSAPRRPEARKPLPKTAHGKGRRQAAAAGKRRFKGAKT